MQPQNQEKISKRLNFTIWTRETDKKILKILKKFFRVLQWLGVIIVVLTLSTAALITIKDEIIFMSDDSSYYDYGDELGDEDAGIPENCNVYGVNLHGELITYISPENYDDDSYPIIDQTASEDVVYKIKQAEMNNNIKAIILEVDSYGGWPVAAEEVANALKKVQKPTIALIREGGVSAAYWAATGADIIFASKNSDVGSIAVTMSYLDYVKQNQKEGLTYNQLSSGKFKDAGDPDKPLTAGEKELLMRDLEILHNNFVKAVAENRNLDLEKVESLADGSTMLGEMALANGLVDKIGGMPEVEKYLSEKIGQEVEVCW